MYYNNNTYIDLLLKKLPSFKKTNIENLPLCVSSNLRGFKHISTLPGFISYNSSSKTNKILKSITSDESILTGFIQSRKINTISSDKYFKKKQYIAVLETHSEKNIFFSKCSRSTRLRLKNAYKKKYHVTNKISTDFYTHYEIMSKIKGFKSVYLYSSKDLKQLNFDINLIPITIYNEEGIFVGGSIIGRYDKENFDYILSCYNKNIKNSGRIVIFESQKYVNQIGGKYLNLGGGTTENDSLFKFKLSFGAAIRTIYYIKIVNCFSKFKAYYKISFDDALNLEHYPPTI